MSSASSKQLPEKCLLVGGKAGEGSVRSLSKHLEHAWGARVVAHWSTDRDVVGKTRGASMALLMVDACAHKQQGKLEAMGMPFVKISRSKRETDELLQRQGYISSGAYASIPTTAIYGTREAARALGVARASILRATREDVDGGPTTEVHPTNGSSCLVWSDLQHLASWLRRAEEGRGRKKRAMRTLIRGVTHAAAHLNVSQADVMGLLGYQEASHPSLAPKRDGGIAIWDSLSDLEAWYSVLKEAQDGPGNVGAGPPTAQVEGVRGSGHAGKLLGVSAAYINALVDWSRDFPGGPELRGHREIRRWSSPEHVQQWYKDTCEAYPDRVMTSREAQELLGVGRAATGSLRRRCGKAAPWRSHEGLLSNWNNYMDVVLGVDAAAKILRVQPSAVEALLGGRRRWGSLLLPRWESATDVQGWWSSVNSLPSEPVMGPAGEPRSCRSLTVDISEAQQSLLQSFLSALDTPEVRFVLGRPPIMEDVVGNVVDAGIRAVASQISTVEE